MEFHQPQLVWLHIGSGPAAADDSMKIVFFFPSKCHGQLYTLDLNLCRFWYTSKLRSQNNNKTWKLQTWKMKNKGFDLLKETLSKVSQELKFYRSLKHIEFRSLKHIELSITYFGAPLSLKNYNDILQLLIAYLLNRKKHIQSSKCLE